MRLNPVAFASFLILSSPSLSSSKQFDSTTSINTRSTLSFGVFSKKPAFLRLRGGHQNSSKSSQQSTNKQSVANKDKDDSMSTVTWTIKCTDVPQFDALEAAAENFRADDKLHLRILCNDSSRCAGLTATHLTDHGRHKIILDYSRQQVNGETMELLFDLLDAVNFTDRREAMRCGVRINSTEDRAVLHHMLRMPKGYQWEDMGVHYQQPSHPYTRRDSNNSQPRYSMSSSQEVDDLPSLLAQVHQVRDQIGAFTDRVRWGEIRGVTGKPLKNFVSVGIGGSKLGAEFVMEALRADANAAQAAEGRTLRFLANVDPVDFHLVTRDLDPEETLIIVISKTFTTAETMLNARTIRNWLVKGLSLSSHGGTTPTKEEIVAHHMIAVSCDPTLCERFGIPSDRVFGFWDWVGGRYSVCSAVGLVPLALQYSMDVMEEFLAGAHDIDEHFFHAPLRDNIPVILGILGVWNSTFMGYTTRALLPYSQALHRFPAHVQQVDMESNGKRVALDGTPLLHESGEILFGEPGTNGQHSFYQLMHQGRVIPADFIGFMESQQPVDLPHETVANHDELMSNFFAQPDALAYGKTLVDLIQEGVPEPLREHMVFAGNRPSSSMLITRLDAFSIGQLLALYEHRAAVQGFVWGINSFDQFGVELGKNLAKHVRTQLSASRKTGASVQGFNSSTSSLLEAYLVHGKQIKQQ